MSVEGHGEVGSILARFDTVLVYGVSWFLVAWRALKAAGKDAGALVLKETHPGILDA